MFLFTLHSILWYFPVLKQERKIQELYEPAVHIYVTRKTKLIHYFKLTQAIPLGCCSRHCESAHDIIIPEQSLQLT